MMIIQLNPFIKQQISFYTSAVKHNSNVLSSGVHSPWRMPHSAASSFQMLVLLAREPVLVIQVKRPHKCIRLSKSKKTSFVTFDSSDWSDFKVVPGMLAIGDLSSLRIAFPLVVSLLAPGTIGLSRSCRGWLTRSFWDEGIVSLGLTSAWAQDPMIRVSSVG